MTLKELTELYRSLPEEKRELVLQLVREMAPRKASSKPTPPKKAQQGRSLGATKGSAPKARRGRKLGLSA